MAGLTLTPEQRRLRARAAAHALHAQGGTSTAAGTAAFLARFEKQVDPENVLPPDERARRAEHARRGYMAGLGLKASKARAKKAPAPAKADAQEDEDVRASSTPTS